MATFNPQTFLAQVGTGKTTLKVPKKQVVCSQGDTVDAVFYIKAGKVKLTVVSPHGKEAVIVILEPGSFFGGRVSRRAAGAFGHGDHRRRRPYRPHRQTVNAPGTPGYFSWVVGGSGLRF